MAEAVAVDANEPIVSPHVGRTVDQVLKLTRYQFREYLRSRRFIVLTAIVVIIGVIITAVIAYFKSSSAISTLTSSNTAFYGTFWGGGVDFVIVLAAVFFGGDAIAGEFQNKTGYFLMGLPIRRSAIFIGKWIAAFGASIAMMGIFWVILIGNGVAYFGTGALPWQMIVSMVFAVVYLAAVLATTFVFSSLFKVSAYGFVLTAILFLFGFTLIGDLVTGLIGVQPWFVISYADAIIGNVFESCIQVTPTVCHPMPWGLQGFSYFPQTSAFRGPGGGGSGAQLPTWVPGISEGIVIMLGYFVLMSLLGLRLFEREEFS